MFETIFKMVQIKWFKILNVLCLLKFTHSSMWQYCSHKMLRGKFPLFPLSGVGDVDAIPLQAPSIVCYHISIPSSLISPFHCFDVLMISLCFNICWLGDRKGTSGKTATIILEVVFWNKGRGNQGGSRLTRRCDDGKKKWLPSKVRSTRHYTLNMTVISVV